MPDDLMTMSDRCWPKFEARQVRLIVVFGGKSLIIRISAVTKDTIQKLLSRKNLKI